MSGIVLILRPEPGAGETAARARALGLEPMVRPLFAVEPVEWDPPDACRNDAILFTSANAPRHAGPRLQALASLPVYAVGEATAAAARAAGFADVRTGPDDGAELLARAARDGIARALHLCGRDRVPLDHAGVRIERRVVYVAKALARALEIPPDAIVLLHSPRAAAEFAGRVATRSGIRLAAISAAASAAAGEGWAAKAVAAAPRDEALLEVARALCNNDRPDGAGAGS